MKYKYHLSFSIGILSFPYTFFKFTYIGSPNSNTIYWAKRMEDGSEKWNFQGNKKLNASSISVRGVYNMLMERVNNSRDKKPLVPLCRVDPTENPLFRTTPEATDSVSTAVNSYNFNCYPPTVGLPDAKRFVHSSLIYKIKLLCQHFQWEWLIYSTIGAIA